MIADLSTQILNNPEENVSLSALLLCNQISNMYGICFIMIMIIILNRTYKDIDLFIVASVQMFKCY